MITIQKVYPTEFLFGNAELAVDKMQVVNKGVLYPQESQRIILTNINKIYADIKSRQTEFSSITDDNGRKQFQEQEITLTQTPRNIKDHLNRLKNYILKLYTNNEIKLTYEELADSMENIQKLLEIFYPAKEVLVDDSEYITTNTDFPLVSLKTQTRKGGRRTRRRQRKQKKTQKRHKKRTNKRKQKKCKKKTIKR
jgi:uncharacterized protein YfkK (UPF0435 family)